MVRRLSLIIVIALSVIMPLRSWSEETPATSILGDAVVDVEQMWRFVNAENADFPIELARHYYEVGRIYGIRGDIALCQAILETGWFKFDKGTAVKPDQHNYCGLGVLKRGMKGHSFKNPRDGVTAQIQHLYAYASTNPLPSGEHKLDKRFGLVSRGSATTWEDLSGKWAANPRYATDILRLYNRLLASADIPAGAGTLTAEEEIMESFTDRVKRQVADGQSAATADEPDYIVPQIHDVPSSEPAKNAPALSSDPDYRFEDPIYVTEPVNKESKTSSRVKRIRR